jgi:DNA-binding CsgD family transcriptional regulator
MTRSPEWHKYFLDGCVRQFSVLEARGRLREGSGEIKQRDQLIMTATTNSFHKCQRLRSFTRELLEYQAFNATHAGALTAPAPRLEVTLPSSRLQVRFLRDHASGCYLLLMEEDVAISPKKLEILGMTRREAEVLGWVALGKTKPEIAVLCDISERTVHKHLEHIYQKLGVETRTAAARLAFTANQRARRD